jgi:hypothetical protein
MLTRDDVLASLRDAEDHLVAEIIATGASLEDLTEALAWMSDDEAAFDAGEVTPTGTVGRLIELLKKSDEARPGTVGDER